MSNISAIIVAKNKPVYLFETISSIQDVVREIIIIDIGIDRSLIAKLRQNKKIKIIEISKDVPYVELVREEVKKYASEEYLLYADPDEIFPEPLIKILVSKYAAYDYIKIPRKNIIFGKWIEHSRWWPDYQIRLFKKNAVIWPTEIHKQPMAKGKEYTVDAKAEFSIIHNNYENIDEFIQKAVRYAKSEAHELSSFSFAEALQKALSEFVSRYFADEGYKDGMHGLILAFLQMFYVMLVFCYVWEKNHYRENDSSAVHDVHTFFNKGLLETNYWIIKKKLDSSFGTIKRKLHTKLTKLLSS